MHPFLKLGKSWLAQRRARREAAFYKRANTGAHSYVASSVQIYGCRNVSIGHHSVISEDTLLNANNRCADAMAIVIGNNCFVGRRNFLTAGALIKLGDYCLTGIDCHFLGSDHLHSSPFHPYLATGTTAEDVIDIGTNCWLGASVVIMKGVKIGFGSIIGAGAVVTRDVPPFSVAVGNPARVIKRFHVPQGEWLRASDYPTDGDVSLPTAEEYLAGIQAAHPALKMPVAGASKSFGDI